MRHVRASKRIAATDAPILARLVVLELVLDHPNHDIIADESPSVHDLLCLPTELGFLGNLLAEHVPCREVAYAELVAYPRGLCTLAWRGASAPRGRAGEGERTSTGGTDKDRAELLSGGPGSLRSALFTLLERTNLYVELFNETLEVLELAGRRGGGHVG